MTYSTCICPTEKCPPGRYPRHYEVRCLVSVVFFSDFQEACSPLPALGCPTFFSPWPTAVQDSSLSFSQVLGTLPFIALRRQSDPGGSLGERADVSGTSDASGKDGMKTELRDASSRVRGSKRPLTFRVGGGTFRTSTGTDESHGFTMLRC